VFELISTYAHWLHTRWPAGTVERLPDIDSDGSTAVQGLYVAGDLTGIPLLKLAVDSGARVVQTIANDASFAKLRGAGGKDVVDLAIVGASVAGMSAALEARVRKLSFVVLEANEPFSTVVNFPKRKPIFLYPTEMRPAGELKLTADVKEVLVDELHAQTRDVPVRDARVDRVERAGTLLAVVLEGGEKVLARQVLVAIGRSGNFRRLGVPGEDLDKVYNRLHDPADFADKDVLVVGGGDTAVETAVALADAGARVTLSYRKAQISRPKLENVERLLRLGDMDSDARAAAGRIRLGLGTKVRRITATTVDLELLETATASIPNDVVFPMIGREPPLDFFRRSGVPIRGEWRPTTYAAFAVFLAFCVLLYLWKAGGALTKSFEARDWFPFNLSAAARSAWTSPDSFLGTFAMTLEDPGFYYSLAYCTCVVLFGFARMRKRPTPYVRLQTWTLVTVQVVPLFLLPYLALPLMGHNGAFDSGTGKRFADALFPISSDVHGREYWRSFGFVLAWPLFIWNVFTDQPMWTWLAISLVQTFVLIPLIVWKWGKGAYCGWICSCGALAETLGDAHRHKMPHGPLWNRVNLVGQVLLAICFALFALRALSWIAPDIPGLAPAFYAIRQQYYHVVDIGLAGIVGVGFYFWFSGRVWCRFACPLAALMHVYARFSRFRIFADKKKCISCNVCTSVCHQGIDVMSFANKGLPMQDPECVRCSACVQMCPTGVLEFGESGARGGRDGGRDSILESRTASTHSSAP